MGTQQESRNLKGIILALLVILLVSGLVGLAVWLLSPGKQNQTHDEPKKRKKDMNDDNGENGGNDQFHEPRVVF